MVDHYTVDLVIRKGVCGIKDGRGGWVIRRQDLHVVWEQPRIRAWHQYGSIEATPTFPPFTTLLERSLPISVVEHCHPKMSMLLNESKR
jgi:hypothetical protein